MTDYISDIDTQRFGFKVARINDFPGDPQVIIEGLKNQGVKLVMARVSTNNIAIINTLENMGFEYKDILLKYCLSLTNKPKLKPDTGKDFQVRSATNDDVDEIVSIAEEAFYNRGHYFADLKLDREKCKEIYKDWARRCCLDKDFADIVFVAENKKEIMGFLSYKILHEKNIAFSRTGLGAIKKKYRGEGIYSELLKYGCNWGIELNLDREEHFVLVNNIAIIRLFTKMGLKIFDSFITMHYWIDSYDKFENKKSYKIIKFVELKWDTQFFGFGVAKLIPDNIFPNELEGLLDSLKKDSYKFVYLFLDPADVDFNQSALNNKGILVDEKITYSVKLKGDVSGNLNDNIVEYRITNKELDKQIINLAVQAGAYSRFKKDPNLSTNQFINLYSAWAKNSLNGTIADHVFIYKTDNFLKGFITLRIKNRTGEIGLIGVEKNVRGQEIGSELIKTAKSFLYESGIFEIHVVTQRENVQACKFYEKNGFSIEKIQNVYHFWV